MIALGKRFAIARHLAQFEQTPGLAPLDRGHEQDLAARWRAMAEQLSLDPELAGDLLERILESSREDSD